MPPRETDKMRRLISWFIPAITLVITACATGPGYKICNDLATTCPNNTANVMVK